MQALSHFKKFKSSKDQQSLDEAKTLIKKAVSLNFKWPYGWLIYGVVFEDVRAIEHAYSIVEETDSVKPYFCQQLLSAYLRGHNYEAFFALLT